MSKSPKKIPFQDPFIDLINNAYDEGVQAAKTHVSKGVKNMLSDEASTNPQHIALLTRLAQQLQELIVEVSVPQFADNPD